MSVVNQIYLLPIERMSYPTYSDLELEIQQLEEENRKLNEKIKRLEFDVDAWHQLKLLLEWEIEKLRWLQICWKTVVERIEDDKKVVRE